MTRDSSSATPHPNHAPPPPRPPAAPPGAAADPSSSSSSASSSAVAPLGGASGDSGLITNPPGCQICFRYFGGDTIVKVTPHGCHFCGDCFDAHFEPTRNCVCGHETISDYNSYTAIPLDDSTPIGSFSAGAMMLHTVLKAGVDGGSVQHMRDVMLELLREIKKPFYLSGRYLREGLDRDETSALAKEFQGLIDGLATAKKGLFSISKRGSGGGRGGAGGEWRNRNGGRGGRGRRSGGRNAGRGGRGHGDTVAGGRGHGGMGRGGGRIDNVVRS